MFSMVRPSQNSISVLVNVKHGLFHDYLVHTPLPSQGQHAFLHALGFIGLGAVLHGDHHFGRDAGHLIHHSRIPLTFFPGIIQ